MLNPRVAQLHVHLAYAGIIKLGELEIDDNEASQSSMKKQKIYAEPAFTNAKAARTSVKRTGDLSIQLAQAPSATKGFNFVKRYFASCLIRPCGAQRSRRRRVRRPALNPPAARQSALPSSCTAKWPPACAVPSSKRRTPSRRSGRIERTTCLYSKPRGARPGGYPYSMACNSSCTGSLRSPLRVPVLRRAPVGVVVVFTAVFPAAKGGAVAIGRSVSDI